MNFIVRFFPSIFKIKPVTSGGGGPTGDGLLLEDGSSFLLLEDGSSFFLLEG